MIKIGDVVSPSVGRRMLGVVIAIRNDGSVFIMWSDGVETWEWPESFSVVT